MKISLIIPTRERATYLKESLKTALAIDDKNVEIVVSDNASLDNTKDVVEEFSDARLKYFRSNERVSMRANFENGLRKSTGDYVSFIGDDDGYLSGQFESLRILLEKERPDNITWVPVSYSWPEAQGEHSKLKIRRRNVFGPPKEIDCERQRHDLLAGTLEPQGAAPAIYHGIAAREFVNRISSSSGVCFNGSIPDIFFGYRSILEGGKFLRVHHPFSMPGRSNASTGAAQSSGSDPSAGQNSGVLFGQENQSDDLRDIIDYALSVPLALFSTLETTIERFPIAGQRPDYREWYAYVLDSCKGRSEADKRSIHSILAQHAIDKGITPLFETAKKRKPAKRSAGERLAREISNIRSIKIDSKLNDTDNIVTATGALDVVLGNEYKDILLNRKSRSAAWKAAKERS